MPTIQFLNGNILFDASNVAMDPACCCVEEGSGSGSGSGDEGGVGEPNLTPCCDNQIPATLTATISSTDCTGWNGVTITMNYDAGLDRWEGTDSSACTETLTLRLYRAGS